MTSSDLEGADLESRVEDQQMPERFRRGLLRHLASPPPGFGARSAAACVRGAGRGFGYANVNLHVQGSCR